VRRLIHKGLGLSAVEVDADAYDDEELNDTEDVKAAAESADANMIKAYARQEPVLLEIITIKNAHKIRSTYLAKLRGDVPDSLIGTLALSRVHPERDITRAITGRDTHKEPNGANFPARGHAKIVRKCVKPAPGNVIVSFDMGQIEARIVCMASNDKAFTKALWHGEDIHMDWAVRFAELYPPLLERAGDMDALRKIIKNTVVFPLFFAAGAGKVAKLNNMPIELAKQGVDEFWEKYASVRDYQMATRKEYRSVGAIRNIFGFRMQGPLSATQLGNLPIQSAAAQLLMTAFGRVVRRAVKLDRESFIPMIDIHDDLSFEVRESEVAELVRIVVPAMIVHQHPAITVPLTTTLQVGRDWESQVKVKEFTSNKPDEWKNYNE
jgi:DNA polymerase-1